MTGSRPRYRSLDDWLRWLEGHHPTEIELGLERIRAVARRAGLDRPGARVISVAGTNGKGSCVAACAALLGAAGLKVGSYTSPHLTHYTERIRIDGVPVDEGEVCQAFAAIDKAAGETSLTYFEFGTLAAFWLFRHHGVDVMVLEVGLGGRLDAVNLLDADVAVVTGVDLDHQAWLGDDRDAIGREKAGIYRAGRPALCADPEPPGGLLKAAGEQGVVPECLGRTFGFSETPGQWHWWGGEGERLTLGSAPQLPGPSLAAALQAVARLGYAVAPLARTSGLERLTLPGRYQRLDWRGREVILDVAHNPAAARLLARRLAAEPARSTLALAAVMADKDRTAMLSPLLEAVDQWWCLELSGLGRAASAQTLASDLAALGVRAGGCGTVSAALEWLAEVSVPGDRVLVAGSFFTVAAALEAMAPVTSDTAMANPEAKR